LLPWLEFRRVLFRSAPCDIHRKRSPLLTHEPQHLQALFGEGQSHETPGVADPVAFLQQAFVKFPRGVPRELRVEIDGAWAFKPRDRKSGVEGEGWST